MPQINEIQKKIAADAFEFSEHAVDQSIIRRISVQELREAVAHGDVIEDYPEDKKGPTACSMVEQQGKADPRSAQPSFSPYTEGNHDL